MNVFADSLVKQELTWRRPHQERLTLSFDEKITFGDYLLLQLFHGVIVLSAVPLNEVNFTEGAPSNDLDQLEVIETDLFVWS